jgi:hypothetical protein
LGNTCVLNEEEPAMSTNPRSTIVGLFADRSDAQRAVNELRRANFREDQIGILIRGEHHGIPPAEVPSADAATHSKITEGAAIGAATGAGIGTLWALGIVAGALPAIGPVVAGGIFMSIIASASGAAAVGTVVGALVGLGIPEEEARYYDIEFAAGRTLVTVNPEGRNVEADAILRRNGSYDMQPTATRAESTGFRDRS